MQKTDGEQVLVNAHRKVRTSTTLNRKYVTRPDTTSVSVRRMTVAKAMQDSANERIRQRRMAAQPVEVKKMTATELKEQAIKKALASAEKIDSEEKQQGKLAKTLQKTKTGLKTGKVKFGFGRVMLALSCTAVAVFAIVYFVNINMPDLSLKVAAMQTGIEASYPAYVPRDYNLADIASENGKIKLNFKNSFNDQAFSLTQEKSSWDSNALLSNFVKDNYSENYMVVREQGLTIYIDGSNATWVNGGIVYKITANSGTLSKKQIRSIAVSL